MVLGHGNNESIVASDIPPLLEYTRDVCFMQDRQIAVLKQSGIKYHKTDRERARERTAPRLVGAGDDSMPLMKKARLYFKGRASLFRSKFHDEDYFAAGAASVSTEAPRTAPSFSRSFADLPERPRRK